MGSLALAACIQDLAVCRRQMGDLAEALADYDHGIALFKSLDAAKLGWVLTDVLANLYRNRAMSLLKARRLEEAMGAASQAVEMLDQLVAQTRNDDCVLDLAASYRDRGVVYRNQGNVQAAIKDYSARLCVCAAHCPWSVQHDVRRCAVPGASQPKCRVCVYERSQRSHRRLRCRSDYA